VTENKLLDLLCIIEVSVEMALDAGRYTIVPVRALLRHCVYLLSFRSNQMFVCLVRSSQSTFDAGVECEFELVRYYCYYRSSIALTFAQFTFVFH
jgi:hypothetical protein